VPMKNIAIVSSVRVRIMSFAIISPLQLLKRK
jgi:hypothetical protein